MHLAQNRFDILKLNPFTVFVPQHVRHLAIRPMLESIQYHNATPKAK
jgi:hypothetical protein